MRVALPPIRRNTFLVSQDSAIDTSNALVGVLSLRATEEQRARVTKRAVAGLAVVLVHILMIALLVIGGRVALTHRSIPRELVLLLPALPNAKPQRLPPPAQSSARPVPMPPPATITLPPPPPAETQKPGDIMEAIGRDIACGAGSYEKLSQTQREACKRHPWHYKKNAKGVIVLDVSPPQQPDDSIPGNDAEIHTLQTNDPCLAAGNTHSECIHKQIFGR